MRLMAKLVIASTVFSTLLTAALLSVFFVQLLRVRLDEANAANRTLGQGLLLSTRQALQSGLNEHPPVSGDEAAFEDAIQQTLQHDDSLRESMEAIIRYAPTVQDVYITGANGRVLVASDPLLDQLPPPRRDSFDAAVHSSLRSQIGLVFGRPKLLDTTFALQRNGQPFLFAHIGIRSTLLRNALNPWLREAFVIGAVALLCSFFAGLLLSLLALRPIERISRRLEALSRPPAATEATPPALPTRTRDVIRRDAVKEVDTSIERLNERIRLTAQENTDLATNLSQMLHTLQDGVLLLTVEGTVVLASDAMQQFLPTNTSIATGMYVQKLFPASTQVGRLIEDALSVRRALHRAEARLADGTPVEVTLAFPPATVGGTRTGFGAMLALHNPAAQQALEREIEVGRRLASIGRLTAGVGHEVKNPINAMVLHLELLRGKLRNANTNDATRHVDVLASEMARLDRVVQTLADFTRPIEPTLREQPLRPIVDAVLQLVSVDASARSIDVILQDEARGVSAAVDGELLHQALLNIVLNAMDAMDGGGRLRVKLQRDSTAVNLSVADTGHGISPELLERIFHLYFTTKATGTGIGLAMTWRLVQIMGGDVLVQSETDTTQPHHGTLFTVRLPLSSSSGHRSALNGAFA